MSHEENTYPPAVAERELRRLRPNMTRAEFVATLSANWSESESSLREIGLTVERCRCGSEYCPGWTLERGPAFRLASFHAAFTSVPGKAAS